MVEGPSGFYGDAPAADEDGESTDSVDSGGGLLPNFITGWGDLTLPATLKTFISDPQRFIYGALLTGLVEWIFGGVSLVIDTILLILGGSEPSTFNAPGETLGIADVPVAIADTIGGVGETVGSGIITGIQSFNKPIFESAAFAGPATPLIVTVVVIVEAVVVLWVAQRVVFVVADWLQLGGLTE